MRLRLRDTPEDYPEHAPIFGRCAGCKKALPYPPIQIPRMPVPKEGQVLKWSMIWDRYCVRCGKKALTRNKEMEILPDRAWDVRSGMVIPNPYKEAK